MKDAGPAYETVDEIHCEYVRGTQLRRRQLIKRIVSRRSSWCLIVFIWQDLRTSGHVKTYGWQPPRFSIERWHRSAERWRRSSKVTMSPRDAQSAFGLLFAADLELLAAAADVGLGRDGAA